MASSNDHCYGEINFELSIYANSLNSTERSIYVDKLKKEFEDGRTFFFPDPYAIPRGKWIRDMCCLPRVDYPDVSNFLVDSKGDFSSKCLKNYKSLAAYEYVISGKVQNVSVYQPDSPLESFRILGGDVQPSQRLNNDCYKTWVIAKENGVVLTAHCTCMVGFGETCSHVAALLFKVELMNRNRDSGPTEKLCKWSNNFSKDVLSSSMSKINLEKGKWTGSKRKLNVNVVPPLKVPPVSDELIAELKRLQPDAVYFTSFVDESETDSASEEEDDLPPTVVEIFKILNGRNVDFGVIGSHFNDSNCRSLEESTRGQDHIWMDHKLGRLTASNFGAVLKRKKWTDKFAESVLFPKSINVPAVKWGQNMEKTALAAYVELSLKTHSDFECRAAGLHVLPNDPHLGASPDGFISCSCCGKGVVEIKCPFSHKDIEPSGISGIDKTFCLDENNEVKESHNYYFQIQGQMALSQTHYCDFVIWTKKGFLVRRVYFDEHFWGKNKNALSKIYFDNCLPFLVRKFRP